jgi:hypothetical protein
MLCDSCLSAIQHKVKSSSSTSNTGVSAFASRVDLTQVETGQVHPGQHIHFQFHRHLDMKEARWTAAIAVSSSDWKSPPSPRCRLRSSLKLSARRMRSFSVYFTMWRQIQSSQKK